LRFAETTKETGSSSLFESISTTDILKIFFFLNLPLGFDFRPSRAEREWREAQGIHPNLLNEVEILQVRETNV